MENLSISIKQKSNKYLSKKYIFLSIVIGLLNSFFYDSKIIMLILCIAEVIVLGYFLFKNNYTTYLSCYMIFLCFSMESATFVGTDNFYGFKNFRIAGINLAVWAIIPLIILALFHLSNIQKKASVSHKKFLRLILMFTVLGVLIGLITYLFDDNGFAAKSGSFSQLFDCSYMYILPLLIVIAVSWVLTKETNRLDIIKQALFSVIIGLTIVYLCCLLFGNYGNRGGIASLQVSEVYFLLVGSLVLVMYKEFCKLEKIILLITSIIILILSLIYNSSGKIVIITVLIPIFMLILLIRRKASIKTLIVSILIIAALLVLIFYIFPLLISNSRLLFYKYEQALSMFSLGDNWLDNMASSPKVRISEFINIVSEYLKKPWYILFGKGFGGTIRDNLSLISSLTSSDYSDWELQLGAYYSMHESLNSFFLVGGVFGLYIFIKIIVIILKKIEKSPWLVIGLMWFVLFYNYHLSISIYGIVALIVGFIEVEQKEMDIFSIS